MTPDLTSIIYTALGILIVSIAGFTVKYLKEISENLQSINIKIAVMIEKHENLERQVKVNHEHLEKRVSDLEEKI